MKHSPSVSRLEPFDVTVDISRAAPVRDYNHNFIELDHSIFMTYYTIDPAFGSSALGQNPSRCLRYTVYGISDCATPSYDGRSEQPLFYILHTTVPAKGRLVAGERHLADATTNVNGNPRVRWLNNSNFNKLWRSSFYGIVVDMKDGLQYRHPESPSVSFDSCCAPDHQVHQGSTLGLVQVLY